MDQLPLDGRLTDLRAFARLGEEGVDLFLVDSTNADVPGFTALERSIGPVLDQVIGKAPRRVIVASFSSHVHRVQQVLDAAAAARPPRRAPRPLDGAQHDHRRRTSATCNVPEGMLIDYKKAARPSRRPDRATCRTGSQGEPMAVLSRMANLDHQIEPGPGRHRHPRLQPHPGQRERRLPRDQRAHQARRQRRAQGQRQGARLRPRGRRRAAVLLQHPQAAAMCCRCTASTGTSWRTRELAQDTGIPEDRTILGENGTVIDLRDGVAPRRRTARHRLRLRRRLDRRRDHGCRPQGPPDPRRRGLHLRHRRRRRLHRQGHRRDPRSTPADSPRTTRCSTA